MTSLCRPACLGALVWGQGLRPGQLRQPVPSCRLWMCTFTLAVSLGAVLLLPFSIISNEVLLSFPQNYYIQWLNGSLVHGECPTLCPVLAPGLGQGCQQEGGQRGTGHSAAGMGVVLEMP